VADVLWLRPEGGEMTNADWHDPSRHTLGMLFDGDAILETDPHGRRIVGDTLLVLFNTGDAEVTFAIPVREGHTWVLEIDTSTETRVLPALHSESAMSMVAKSVMVLREVRPASNPTSR
jgi:glycogen operon protein